MRSSPMMGCTSAYARRRVACPLSNASVLPQSHTSHQLLAVYAMGAPASLMNPILRLHDVRTEPARPSPGDIRDDNFYDHLGDRRSASRDILSYMMLNVRGPAITSRTSNTSSQSCSRRVLLRLLRNMSFLPRPTLRARVYPDICSIVFLQGWCIR